MLGKIWKKVLVFVLIVACLFNIVRILVHRVPLLQELQASLAYFYANSDKENTNNINGSQTSQDNMNNINQNSQGIQNGQEVQPQRENQGQGVQQNSEQQNTNQQRGEQLQNNGQANNLQNGGQNNNQQNSGQTGQWQERVKGTLKNAQNQIQSSMVNVNDVDPNERAYLDNMYLKSLQQNENYLAQSQQRANP